ncbi:MAG: hypothetical protein DIU78_022610 [Pseudomonadota bacterium]
MNKFLKVALDTIQDQHAPRGIQSLAALALLGAMENELEVPSGAPLAVWEWLCGAGRDTIRLAVIGRIPGEEVLRRALDVLRDPQAGDDLQELAETVVAHATDLSIVTDDTIRALLDGEPGPARAGRLTSILESLHTNRGIPSALLRELRDRWARSPHVHLRVEAVTVAGLLPGLDIAFATKMLDDPSPKVRSAAIDLLEQADSVGRAEALRLLRDRLQLEEHTRVRSDIYFAVGSLTRARRSPATVAGSDREDPNPDER